MQGSSVASRLITVDGISSARLINTTVGSRPPKYTILTNSRVCVLLRQPGMKSMCQQFTTVGSNLAYFPNQPFLQAIVPLPVSPSPPCFVLPMTLSRQQNEQSKRPLMSWSKPGYFSMQIVSVL